MLTNELNNDAVQLLAALRARGVRLGLSFTADGLTPTFGGSLDDADRAALAAHREGLLVALLAEARALAARRDDDTAAVERAVEWGEGLEQFWEE
jgi:hypothetical protein